MLSQKESTTAAKPTPEEEGGVRHLIGQLTCKLKCDVTCEGQKQHNRWPTEKHTVSQHVRYNHPPPPHHCPFYISRCLLALGFVYQLAAAHSRSLLPSVPAGDEMCFTRAFWARRQSYNCTRQALAAKYSKLKNCQNYFLFFLTYFPLFLICFAFTFVFLWLSGSFLSLHFLLKKTFKASNECGGSEKEPEMD